MDRDQLITLRRDLHHPRVLRGAAEIHGVGTEVEELLQF
jgi:hypothetical protein